MSIELRDVSYVYGSGMAYSVTALSHVSMKISDGEYIGIIGHTGSGKSTLIQHLNGLIRPTGGEVLYRGENIWADGYSLRTLRSHVGLVFQYPEHQLFESTVLADVCFGPKNQGLPENVCIERARTALEQLGIGESYFQRAPFELSGGQKRRIAIAGVLAMEPDVLILDEPTAGLDPRGRDEIFELIHQLRQSRKITILLVSHSMEDVAKYADRLIVMNAGEKVFDDTPHAVFAHYKELETMGLAAPQVTYMMHELKARGFQVDVQATTVAEAKKSILQALHVPSGMKGE